MVLSQDQTKESLSFGLSYSWWRTGEGPQSSAPLITTADARLRIGRDQPNAVRFPKGPNLVCRSRSERHGVRRKSALDLLSKAIAVGEGGVGIKVHSA